MPEIWGVASVRGYRGLCLTHRWNGAQSGLCLCSFASWLFWPQFCHFPGLDFPPLLNKSYCDTDVFIAGL